VGNGGTTGQLGSGAVINNGSLVFNRSDAISVSNPISGNGSLTQAGFGSLTLSGAKTYTGNTFVNDGTLVLDGSLAGSVIVAAPAQMGGAGFIGGTLTVNVQVENGANLGSVAPLRIKYDADLLRLEDIAPGDIFSKGGGGATSTKDIRNDAGEASITISRLPGAAGVSGPGTLAVLTFTAIGSGEAPMTVEEVALKDAQAQAVGVVAPPALGVRIQ